MENTITTYDLFKNICIELIDDGAKRISPLFVIELIRQRHHFSISNNDGPVFRDQFVLEHPEFSKFFLIKGPAKGKHAKGPNFHFLQLIESLDCEVTQVTLKNSKGQTYTLSKAQAERVAKSKT